MNLIILVLLSLAVSCGALWFLSELLGIRKLYRQVKILQQEIQQIKADLGELRR